MKTATWDCSRLLFGAAAASLVLLLVAVGGRPAAAQAADAEERCTGDVMRHCSEFVPDADSIVVCLKAKRLQLSPSCFNALSPAPPEPLALYVPPTKKAQKARRPAALVATPPSTTKVRHQASVAR